MDYHRTDLVLCVPACSMRWQDRYPDIRRTYWALYVPIWQLVFGRYVYRECCCANRWRVDILRLHNECVATTSRAHTESIGSDYSAGRTRHILQLQHGRAATTSRSHTNAMNVLNGHLRLLSVYSLNFRMNYCTMVDGFLVQLWHNVQWSYGTMNIQLR